MEKPRALFIGMVTWDVVYLSDSTPSSNEKMMAQQMTLSAGGPASNAAVTYASLGGEAQLVASCGKHPVAGLIKDDLKKHSVPLLDLNPEHCEPPPVSSIVVNSKTGSRAVISMNSSSPTLVSTEALDATWRQLRTPPSIILADGHQAQTAVRAKTGFPSSLLVLDCGSWRDGFADLLPLADVAICSGHFFPPGCSNTGAVLAYVSNLGVKHVAVSQGSLAIEYLSEGVRGALPVPSVPVVDTMGAGDVLHGAYCRYCLDDKFEVALQKASNVASFSCRFFGTRSWPGQWSAQNGP